MLSASSPIAHVQTSSPPVSKRPRFIESVQIRKPKSAGGFLIQDESEDDDGFTSEEPAPKRQMLRDLRTLNPDKELSHTNEDILRPTEMDILKRLGDDQVDEGKSIPSRLPKSVTTSQEHAQEFDTLASPALVDSQSNVVTCSGKSIAVRTRRKTVPGSFEQLVANRSTTKAGRAKKSFYGIEIHALIEDAKRETLKDKTGKEKISETALPSIEDTGIKFKPSKSLMWTEKYRARNFLELVGDDRIHRQVLRWLKAWDPIVFPKSGKAKSTVAKGPVDGDGDKAHRKILLLTGPPGLGKTTLAHVCARQAGYEVMEINASDDRSREVVKGRIKTSVGTENVKIGSTVTSKSGHVQKNAHPLCVVVDEVDGVVSGSGGSGEGGFVKALIDLILLDQKNSSVSGTNIATTRKIKKKSDEFKLLRPLILICNDVYHPSLRPLRQSNLAEIIHVRNPPLDAVIARVKTVFEKEGISCDEDAVRRLCEASWGVHTAESRRGKEGTGEGDLRGVMVVGEWAAGKLRASTSTGGTRLTRQWVEKNMIGDLSHGGGGARGVGRGGAKEIVRRVFLEGAGFPRASFVSPTGTTEELPKTALGVTELVKKAGIDRLTEMVNTSGEIDRIVTDIFSEYPNRPFNDDSALSKPDAAYEWLNFHDSCSSRVFTKQEFELAPYLNQPVLACHHLFAFPVRHHLGNAETKKWSSEEKVADPLPFTGPRADHEAYEAEKSNRAIILNLQASLDATLLRSFRSPEDIATDLIPYLVRMLTPDINPIIVGGSRDQKGMASVRKEGEKDKVQRSVEIMGNVSVIFERGKLEGDFAGGVATWVYRMEPPLDTLVYFETANCSASATPPVRYAVRQVLDQEYQKNKVLHENAARQARYRAGKPINEAPLSLTAPGPQTQEQRAPAIELGTQKRDFFGRVVEGDCVLPIEAQRRDTPNQGRGHRVWVTFHEGFSNAVRKPVTIAELLREL